MGGVVCVHVYMLLVPDEAQAGGLELFDYGKSFDGVELTLSWVGYYCCVWSGTIQSPLQHSSGFLFTFSHKYGNVFVSL